MFNQKYILLILCLSIVFLLSYLITTAEEPHIDVDPPLIFEKIKDTLDVEIPVIRVPLIFVAEEDDLDEDPTENQITAGNPITIQEFAVPPPAAAYVFSSQIMNEGIAVMEGRSFLLPEIAIEYKEAFVSSFDSYSNFVQNNIGGKFYIYCENSHRLLSALDIRTGKLDKVGSLDQLSSRVRIIRNELAVKKFVSSGTSVAFMVSKKFDGFIYGSIRNYLISLSNAPSIFDFSCFQGAYKEGGKFIILNKGIFKDGRKELIINIKIPTTILEENTL